MSWIKGTDRQPNSWDNIVCRHIEGGNIITGTYTHGNGYIELKSFGTNTVIPHAFIEWWDGPVNYHGITLEDEEIIELESILANNGSIGEFWKQCLFSCGLPANTIIDTKRLLYSATEDDFSNHFEVKWL